MTQLTDTQLILLSTAHGRDSGGLLPLPKSLSDPATAPAAIKQLIRRGYAEERVVTAKGLTWRADGEKALGAFLTDKGRLELTSAADIGSSAGNPVTGDAGARAGSSGSKREAAIALLQRGGGATIDDLTAATGWLPHSARAVLSGLRKGGQVIERTRTDTGTRYAITGAGQ